ncbi:MAG: DUF512 domain-containing protein [Lachnospiraceae bacterium]|nr:DUF512 domain-containing protein [Lachnospiraceae bacterium]
MADLQENKKLSNHLISYIEPDSPADRAGVQVGDILLAIDGHPLLDIFDYHFRSDEPRFVMTIQRGAGTMELPIRKEEGEDTGLQFGNGLMDEYRSCRNGCIFCFIDQMPPGMRDTLYFKDDDTRLSFLQGNYVTLTNLSDEDLDRIIQYRMAPINVSVHATDPECRMKLLRNRFAGDVLIKMKRIADAGLPMNAQIVLCRGINDGAQLRKSISDLFSLYPALSSVSVVPVGLTRYREKLYPLVPFDRESAREVLRLIHTMRRSIHEKCGRYFVHASDEWYLLAGLSLPGDEAYDGYPQLENGVGMLRLLIEEFRETLRHTRRSPFMRRRKVSVATGLLAAPYIEKLCRVAARKYRRLSVRVCPIRNDFFGEQITVSGLITGRDLIRQLRGRDLGQVLLLPQNMFRAGEEVFLDDVTLGEVRSALQLPVHIVKSSGEDLLKAILGRD